MRWLMRSCCRGVSAEAPVPAAASAGTGLPAFCYPSSSTNSKSVEDEKIPDTSDENSGPQKPHAGERSGNSAVKPRPLTGRGCAKAGRVQVQPQGGTQARTVHKMLEMENRRRPAPGASGSGGGGRPALALLGSQPVGVGGAGGHYLGIPVVEIGGQEAVGQVAFDEARRRQLLQRGRGQRSSEDTQASGPSLRGPAERVSDGRDQQAT